MKEWETIQLYYACKLVAGYAFKSKDFGDYPDKVIKITHIVPPTVDMKNLTGVDLSQYERKKLIKYIAKQGDYVLAMTGATIGKMGRIEESEAYVNQRVLLFKNNPNVDKDYLFYVLQQNKFQQYILNHIDSESAQPNISAATVGKYEFLLPSLKMQNKIGKFLRLIDDKINVNNRINDNLLEQALTLYKKYFPYNVDDEFPNGWRIGTVGEIIEIHDSKRIPLSSAERMKMTRKIYPYYGAASLMDYVDDFIFNGKYLLLGEDGTVVDSSGYPILQYVCGKFWVNNHTHILTGKLGFNVESLYMLFKQTPVKSIVTGAVQPKISQTNLRSIRVVIPPKKLLKDYNCLVDPLFSLFRLNKEENKSLATLRDTLLPKLMSGEIDVSSIKI